MLMREAEYAVHADGHNWKFAWFGEHHCLTEYSHMSAPSPMMGYVAAKTERIHIGSAITSLPTAKEHPVRYAERAAMLDHPTEGRFEFGPGRGARGPGGSRRLAQPTSSCWAPVACIRASCPIYWSREWRKLSEQLARSSCW